MKKITEVWMWLLDSTIYNERVNSRICWSVIIAAAIYFAAMAIMI